MPKRAREPRACVQCGRVWLPYEDKTRFCSKSCEWHAVKGPDFNAMISRQTAVARAARLRERGDESGKWYRKVDGRHEHRTIIERYLGRRLRSDEVVHHKDRDKRNNDLDNLEVKTRAEHMREHGIGIPGVTLWWKPWEKRWVK